MRGAAAERAEPLPATDSPEVQVVFVLDGRVVLVDLGGQLVLQLLRFFQVQMDFLLLPGFSVHTISNGREAGAGGDVGIERRHDAAMRRRPSNSREVPELGLEAGQRCLVDAILGGEELVF